MPRLLEDRDSHALVQHDDGEVELIPWSPLNKLVYQHGLDGLLKEGDETLVMQRSERPTVRIIPNDDATEFDLKVGEDAVHIEAHQKSELVERIVNAYEQGDDRASVQPFIDWASELLDTAVNKSYVDQFADLPVFADAVEVQQNGWLIHDHLLLTYENEFYHPDIESRGAGDATLKQSDAHAYEVRFRDTDDGQMELTDFNYIGEASDQEEFIARAIWAVKHAPEIHRQG